MMRFEPRVFTLAKDAERPEENQDACRTDAEQGVAAIADGVASSIFARQWAQVLTEAVVAGPPDLASHGARRCPPGTQGVPGDREALARWLARRREAWAGQIDVSELAWYQKPKLREGAFSTLLWVEILPIDQSDRQPQDPWRLRVFAVGDSCLFHVRRKQLLRSFPVERADELEADPVVIGSVDLNRDERVEFRSFEAICRPGDLLVLSTDAVAEWALRQRDAGRPPEWEEYWSKAEHAWQEEVTSLRQAREMRYDDATLLLLRVGDGVTAPDEADRSAPAAEAAAAEQHAGPAPDAKCAPQPEWARKLKSLSEQLADQVSGPWARGASKLKDKLKEMRQSAESALKKYRDKFRSDQQDPPPDA